MQSGKLITQLQTDATGNLRVGLPVGTYQVRFSAAGLADQILSVHVSMAKTTSLKVVLRKPVRQEVSDELLVLCDVPAPEYKRSEKTATPGEASAAY